MTPREALRPWATSAATSRALRAMHREALDATPLVFVVLMPGAPAPETIPAALWRDVGGRRVAVVDVELAREVAALRAPEVAAGLARQPPPRGCWCVALEAGGGAFTWSTPLSFLGPQRHAGDA